MVREGLYIGQEERSAGGDWRKLMISDINNIYNNNY